MLEYVYFKWFTEALPVLFHFIPHLVHIEGILDRQLQKRLQYTPDIPLHVNLRYVFGSSAERSLVKWNSKVMKLTFNILHSIFLKVYFINVHILYCYDVNNYILTYDVQFSSLVSWLHNVVHIPIVDLYQFHDYPGLIICYTQV